MYTFCLAARQTPGITYALTWDLKRRDDQHKQHALATGLLSEIRLLDNSLRSIHGDTTAAYRVIEPFQTAIYDQAGANLLLFAPETVQALNIFYHEVHELRTTLARFRVQYPGPGDLAQRHPPRDQAHRNVRILAANASDDIADVATRLDHEGGQRPGPLPSLRARLVGSQIEVPELKPSGFEDQK